MKSEVKENKVDFSLIRYSQCWEDTEVLLEGLDIKENDVCLGILSAGDNVFSMLTKNPAKIIALDISFPQIALVRLKIEVFKEFSYEKMLEFIGVKKSDKRAEMYEKIRGNLEEKVREYWDFNKEAVQSGVIHTGKFEKFFSLFRKRILPFVHSKKQVEEFLSEKSETERIQYYNKKWNNFRWKMMFKLFFSNYIVGKFGRDKEFFKYVEKDISKVMTERSRYASCELSPYENPYLNYILTGNYRSDCLPYVLREENFEKIRENIHKIEIVQNSMEEYLDGTDLKINKFNLSDIFEYMSLENYEKLMEKIYEKSADEAKLVYWNLVVERNTGLIKGGKEKRFERLERLDKELHKKDKTFFYTDFVVEKVIKNGNS